MPATKKMIRKIFIGILVIAMALVIWHWSLVTYGIEQGWGQASIIWKAKPVEKILKDPGFPDSLKAKLQLIEEIRRFAIDSLDLKDTENYRTVYDQQGKELMWVVMACEPFHLTPRLWDFPVVGSVPYKGYFNKEKALAERKRLEAEGLDVSVRNPGGWSTLGWFTDPILSKMLERNEGDLASLIIHEMVHATLWVKDSVDFNENLASFIGDTAAYEFLKYKFGKNSAKYVTYVEDDQNYRKFSGHMLRGAQALDSLYESMPATLPLAEKRNRKDSFIRHIVQTLDTLTLYNNPEPSKRFGKHLPNNAYFMSFRHYGSKLNTFKKEMTLLYPGDLRGYLRYLVVKYPK
jgi:predicted aminopeptidase